MMRREHLWCLLIWALVAQVCSLCENLSCCRITVNVLFLHLCYTLSGVRLSGSRLQDGDLHARSLLGWALSGTVSLNIKVSFQKLRSFFKDMDCSQRRSHDFGWGNCLSLSLSSLLPSKKFFLVRTFKFYPLSKFQWYNRVLSTTVTKLFIH